MVLQPIHDVGAVVDELGRQHRAIVVGFPRGDGSWDGFIEFHDEEGGVRVTPRETTLPNASDLVCWASGLSERDIERALDRATEEDALFPNARRPRAVV